MGPKIGYFGFESLGFGFYGFEGHSMTWKGISRSIIHESFVSPGGFSAKSLGLSEENKIKTLFTSV